METRPSIRDILSAMETGPRMRTKRQDQDDGNALTAIGMLLGAALGAAVALVYSPGTGKQNRKNLTLWAHHRLDEIQRKAEGVVKREQDDGRR